MGGYQVEFDSPSYLWLLLLLPLLWWFSFRSLAGLGRVRRLIAMVLRTAVLTAVILALAEIQWVRTSDRLTVVFVLDQSKSIPSDERARMREYVNRAIRDQREGGDRAGVITFGREASIEIPPFDDLVQLSPDTEAPLDPMFTNLESALRLAAASFPEDSAKRIVIISDGNENLGNALEQVQGLLDAGVGIDVHPIFHGETNEVLVEKIAAPAEIRSGQPYDLRVVVNNTSTPTADSDGTVSGKLIIKKTIDGTPYTISEDAVVLAPGKNFFRVRQEDEPDFYRFSAQFVPDDPADDEMVDNNTATAFTMVRGSGRVLLVEGVNQAGEHDRLIASLRAQDIDVEARTSEGFRDLADLQEYDAVILANAPREDFTDAQVEALVRNTEQLGGGLIMLGGPSSFGAGGWINSPIEKAMPVDFQIKAAKVIPKGALALLMHASEMAEGNFWQKKIASEAIRALGYEDYCALLHWNGTDQWLWRQPNGFARVGPDREMMLAKLDRMVPGDMPQFDPGLIKARRSFATLKDAAAKHMIIISDGDPTPPTAAVVQGFVAGKITVSTVAVGTHGPAGSTVLRRLAQDTGGKYYAVQNPNALPKIFQREARRVSRPLIFEDPAGIAVQSQFPHEIIAGVESGMPPISGYVLTTVKENPLVEVSLAANKPPGKNNAILASWRYGLGRSVAFTSDAGTRWTTDWTGWSGYEKFFSQMVRWAMRPESDEGHFHVETDYENGKVRVIVTALDKDDEFINFLNVSGAVVGPQMETGNIELDQVAPGRYEAEFDADDPGTHFVVLNSGPGQPLIRRGVNVPYSPEFRERMTDESLLSTLASLKPSGGEPGALIEDPSRGNDVETLLATNTFRHTLRKATSSQDAWHLIVLFGSCLFFFDVFIRRVSVSFAWVAPLGMQLRDRVFGRDAGPSDEQYMERLRSRKAEVAQSIETRQASARYEVDASAPVDDAAVKQELGDAAADPPAAGPASLAPEADQDEESYTSRLLRAKNEARRRQKGK